MKKVFAVLLFLSSTMAHAKEVFDCTTQTNANVIVEQVPTAPLMTGFGQISTNQYRITLGGSSVFTEVAGAAGRNFSQNSFSLLTESILTKDLRAALSLYKKNDDSFGGILMIIATSLPTRSVDIACTKVDRGSYLNPFN